MTLLDATASRPPLTADEPWPGLAPFEEDDAAYFNGRVAEVEALRVLVAREDLVLLYGASGLGKTSLLRAGLLPGLPSTILPVYVRLHIDEAPGAFSSDDLRRQVLAAIEGAATRAGVERPPPAVTGTLWEYFRRRDRPFWGKGNEIVIPLLVFDPFEEVLRSLAGPAKTALLDFLQDLGDVVHGRIPQWLEPRLQSPTTVERYIFESSGCKAILSFREEFLAEVKRLTVLVSGTDRNSFRLEPMEREAATEAARRSAAALIAPDASGDDVVAAIVTEVVGSSEPEARVEPVLLSVFCKELNHQRKARLAAGGPALIDLALVNTKASGTIIEDYYGRAVSQLPERVRQFIEDRLVLPSGARNSVALEELGQAGIRRDAIDALTNHWRILRVDLVGARGQMRLELVHDRLVEPVIAGKRRRADQRAESRRWLAATSAGLVCLLAVCLVVLFWRWSQQSDASYADELSKDSRRATTTEPIESLTLAIKAVRTSHTSDAVDALKEALRRAYPRTYLNTAHVAAAGISDDGHAVGTLHSDGSIRIWNIGTGGLSASYSAPQAAAEAGPSCSDQDGGFPFGLRLLPDGRVAIVGDRGVRILRRSVTSHVPTALTDDSLLAALPCARADGISGAATIRAFSSGPQRLDLLIVDDTEVRIVEARTGITRARAVLDGDPTRHALSPDGQVMMMGGDVGPLSRYRVEGGRLTPLPLGPCDVKMQDLKGVSLADGGNVAMAFDNTHVALWTRDGACHIEPAMDGDTIRDATLSLDGATLVVANSTGRTLVRRGAQTRAFTLGKRPTQFVRTTPSGTLVLVVAQDGPSSVWDVTSRAAPSDNGSVDAKLKRAEALVPIGWPPPR